MNDGCVKWFKGSMFLRADTGYHRRAYTNTTEQKYHVYC